MFPVRFKTAGIAGLFFWPEETCTNAQLGEGISSYIQNFDCALKAFFELDEQNWKVGIEQISLQYQKAIQKEKILL